MELKVGPAQNSGVKPKYGSPAMPKDSLRFYPQGIIGLSPRRLVTMVGLAPTMPELRLSTVSSATVFPCFLFLCHIVPLLPLFVSFIPLLGPFNGPLPRPLVPLFLSFVPLLGPLVPLFLSFIPLLGLLLPLFVSFVPLHRPLIPLPHPFLPLLLPLLSLPRPVLPIGLPRSLIPGQPIHLPFPPLLPLILPFDRLQLQPLGRPIDRPSQHLSLPIARHPMHTSYHQQRIIASTALAPKNLICRDVVPNKKPICNVLAPQNHRQAPGQGARTSLPPVGQTPRTPSSPFPFTLARGLPTFGD